MVKVRFLFTRSMPKKKILHKGKSKSFTEENNDFAFRKNENEEEYTTVVESDTNKKYSKRPLNNNWSKYDVNLSDFESLDEVEEKPKTDDFSHLLKTASSDCSHFQFNSEKLWKSEENTVPPYNIFNLDLNILSSSLACVPFYERIGLDENCLSVEDKQKLDADAEKSLKEYYLLKEKLKKNAEDEPKIKNSYNLRTTDESLKDLKVRNEKDTPEVSGSKPFDLDVKDEKKVDVLESRKNDVKKGKNKLFFSENDEDLEVWLDSVLDD